jgi:hypothetical protein
LSTVRTHRPPPTATRTHRYSHCMPCVRTRSSHRTAAVRTSRRTPAMRRRPRPLQQQAACRSTAPGGDWIARGGSLTVSLCVRQAVSGYRDTQTYTQDYLSTTASLLFFIGHFSGLCRPICRHLNVDTSDEQALQDVITMTLMVEPSMSESSPIQAVAPPMHIRLHQAS